MNGFWTQVTKVNGHWSTNPNKATKYYSSDDLAKDMERAKFTRSVLVMLAEFEHSSRGDEIINTEYVRSYSPGQYPSIIYPLYPEEYI